MNLWHLTQDAPREPSRVSPGQSVELVVGTWPIASGQSVRVTWRREGIHESHGTEAAYWQANKNGNSYWRVSLGRFANGDTVSYTIHGASNEGHCEAGPFTFSVKPALSLAILWHHHQPLYRDPEADEGVGSYLHPWVRLHALRDYYGMAAIAAEHKVPVTFNFTPVLLRQLDDYVQGNATDAALELTQVPAERLTGAQTAELVGSFFDADWHRQVYPHPRYRELLEQRMVGGRFSTQDLRDLQMWWNLAWFAHEFRAGDVRLISGETVTVRRFVDQGRGFSQADIRAMVLEQYKILRAIGPLHRHLQEHGLIEVSTTPGFHPILPLLIDTDAARIDRPGGTLPQRFAYLEDAEAQVDLALSDYTARLGTAPRGMWPAEGAVSEAAARCLASRGVRWIATDRGVLARSGRWGYDVERASVSCQPYRFSDGTHDLAIFFRDTELSDAIGFHYQSMDAREAAESFIRSIEQRFLCHLEGDEDYILTIVLDGENAWGAYADDGRPFLHALYERIAADPRLQAVTFNAYLQGDRERRIGPHPVETLRQIDQLATGSWIDESGSAPGVDLGTWIGEAEENKAWNLLGAVRTALGCVPKTLDLSAALLHVYAAEGSDWFWWLGDDQESSSDPEFDDLFRRHLRQACRMAGISPAAELDQHIVPHRVLWTFTRPVDRVPTGDLLVVRTNCPGFLVVDHESEGSQRYPLTATGGVMAGARRFQVALGPFGPATKEITFVFHCEHEGCEGGPCCLGLVNKVVVAQQ